MEKVRYEVKFTKAELAIVVEALGEHKRRLRSVADKRVNKYGPPHRGRSLARLTATRSASAKMELAKEKEIQ